MTEKQYLQIMEEIKAGKSVPMDEKTEIEFDKARREYNLHNYFLPKLIEYRKNEDWKGFCDYATSNPEYMPYSFLYYDVMPNEFRRDFVVQCYMSHGDSFSPCRKALKKLPKNGIYELPVRYREKEFITVYRAGEEPLSTAPYRLSWSLSKKVAEWFLDKYIGKHAQYLYSAKIRPCDVIAYTNERKEQEVLQYRKVFDIKILRTIKSD